MSSPAYVALDQSTDSVDQDLLLLLKFLDALGLVRDLPYSFLRWLV